MIGAVLSISAILVPLVGATAALATRTVGARLVPVLWIGPLPALVLTFAVPSAEVEVPWLLLGSRLALQPGGRVLLVLTAVLWFAAALTVPALLRADVTRGRLASPFLGAMAGTIAVALAADVVTFYTGFALVTYASYALVTHEQTTRAVRAGRIYLVFAVIGEALLLGGLLLTVASAGTLDLDAARQASADSAGGLAAPLLLVGFGIKAGMAGLHGWLPLAHPAAPVPASAALSGVIIKAGLLGWLRFLPLGEADFLALGIVCVVLGLLGTFGGAAIGILQNEPKTILAYSSISQMGLMLTAIGVAFAVPDSAPLAAGAALVLAFHHGFAKGTLFLGVGVLHAVNDRWRRLVLAGQTVAAIALAGAPLTSGMAAKDVLKDAGGELPGAFGDVMDAMVLPLAGTATTVLLGRLLTVSLRQHRHGQAEVHPHGRAPNQGPPARARGSAQSWMLLAGWTVALLATLGATWTFAGPWLSAVPVTGPFDTSLWLDAFWPVALGAVLLFALGPRPPAGPRVPAGDVAVASEVALRHVHAQWGEWARSLTRQRGRAVGVSQRPLATISRAGLRAQTSVDRVLDRWQVVALAAIALLAALTLTFLGT